MKKLLLFLLLLVIPFALIAQERKKVAVVLSGGGAKGVAHISALKVIEEAGIPIDYIVGTSMGAIVGGLYAIGYTPHQMDSMVRAQDWSFLLSDRLKRSEKTFEEKMEDEKYVISLNFKDTPKEVLPDGLIRGQNLHDLFTTLTVGYHDSIDFNKLPIPFACVAVDLMQGKEVVFHSGILAEAMRASMAIPAAFTPVRLDSMVLVDGGMINNFPVDVAREMGAELVVGVDVQSGINKKDNKIMSVADMVGKILDITSKDKYRQNLKETDVHIHVNVEGYSSASFSAEAIDTLIARGEVAAREEWDDLLALKQRVGVPADFVPPPHGPYVFLANDAKLRIRGISFTGLENPNTPWLLKKCNLTENSEMTITDIDKAISGLYSTQIYTNVKYRLNEIDDGGVEEYDLQFSLENNRVNSFKLGVRFDTEEVASALLKAEYYLKTRIPTSGVVIGRLGKRTGVRLDYNIFPALLRNIHFSYMYQYNDINVYSHGKREYNMTYHHNFAEIGYRHTFNQNLMMSFDLNYERFNYKNFLFNDETKSMVVPTEDFFNYTFTLQYESMNRKSFPTSGSSLQAEGTIYTDNTFQYNGHVPFASVSIWYKTVFSVTDRFAIIPGFYGRVLMGRDVPYSYLNTMGGDMPGRYIPQQLPFAGIDYMAIFENSLTVLSTELRQRIGKKHYISLKGNYGLTNSDFTRIFKGRSLYGGSIGYGYDSLFGPLEANFNISNETDKLGFYASLGYKF